MDRYFCQMQTLVAIFFLVIVSFSSTPIIAAESANLGWGPWNEAKTLFDAGKFSESIIALEKNKTNDSSFYYNLGTVYLHMGDSGKAVAYLEKANRIKPHDSDIQQNLELAKTAISKTHDQARLDAASIWIEAIADNAPLDEVRAVLGLLTFIMILFWIKSYSKYRSVRHTLIQPSGLIALFAITITIFIYASQRLATSHPPAVSLDSQAVRSGPGERFIELNRLFSGQKVRLLGPSAKSGDETWRQVRYSKEDIGWLKESSLLPL